MAAISRSTSSQHTDGDGKSFPINVFNETATPKTIIVLGRDHHVPLTAAILDEAWRIIQIGPNVTAKFEYPQATAVGASYYKDDGTLVSIGPYEAPSGTTWRFETESPYEEGKLTQEMKAPPVHEMYMVYNKLPTTWFGRKINVALYKSSKALVIKKNVRVGDYVELKLTDKLYFCCMETQSPTMEYEIEEFFTKKQNHEEVDFCEAEFTPLMKLDMKRFPGGVNVTIQENEMSGQILFIPKPCFS